MDSRRYFIASESFFLINTARFEKLIPRILIIEWEIKMVIYYYAHV